MEQTHNLPSALAPEARPAVSHWHAGYNQPGYLPEADPDVYASFEDAREALAFDMEHHAANEESWNDPHDCDDIPCPTFGDDCHWQRAADIRAERDDLLASDGLEWSGAASGLAYWVTACDDPDCVEVLVARAARMYADLSDISALVWLGICGAVLPGAAEEADEQRQTATAVEQSDLELLCTYIGAVGYRGPVSDWPAP